MSRWVVRQSDRQDYVNLSFLEFVQASKPPLHLDLEAHTRIPSCQILEDARKKILTKILGCGDPEPAGKGPLAH
jgi:hypothetical protein